MPISDHRLRLMYPSMFPSSPVALAGGSAGGHQDADRTGAIEMVRQFKAAVDHSHLWGDEVWDALGDVAGV